MASFYSSINWRELPSNLTFSILIRLSVIEILENVQKVCRGWRRVCKDPSMWRKIDLGNHRIFGYNPQKMCRHAIDRSQGGLVEINVDHFGTDSLLTYIADRANNLRCLRLSMCHPLTNEGIVNAVNKFPLLEDLKIQHCHSQLNLKAIGHSCPFLKTLKVNRTSIMISGFECDDDALAIAEIMPKLRHLKLFGNRVTNTGLNAIPDNCPHLEHLDLRQCFNINLAGDMEKRCFERIKDFRRPNDSTAGHPLDHILYDNDFIEEEYDGNHPFDEEGIEFILRFE